MKRLRDYQQVHLALAGRAERCFHVIATQGGQAVLQPDADGAHLRLHGPHRAVLRFATARGQVAMLRGWATAGVLEGTVTFTQGDRAHLPRSRRAPRLVVGIDAVVTGEISMPNRTRDIAADAIVFEQSLGPLGRETVEIDLRLPALVEPLALTGHVADGRLVHLDPSRSTRVLEYFVLLCRQQVARHAAAVAAQAA